MEFNGLVNRLSLPVIVRLDWTILLYIDSPVKPGNDREENAGE